MQLLHRESSARQFQVCSPNIKYTCPLSPCPPRPPPPIATTTDLLVPLLLSLANFYLHIIFVCFFVCLFVLNHTETEQQHRRHCCASISLFILSLRHMFFHAHTHSLSHAHTLSLFVCLFLSVLLTQEGTRRGQFLPRRKNDCLIFDCFLIEVV